MGAGAVGTAVGAVVWRTVGAAVGAWVGDGAGALTPFGLTRTWTEASTAGPRDARAAAPFGTLLQIQAAPAALRT